MALPSGLNCGSQVNAHRAKSELLYTHQSGNRCGDVARLYGEPSGLGRRPALTCPRHKPREPTASVVGMFVSNLRQHGDEVVRAGSAAERYAALTAGRALGGTGQSAAARILRGHAVP